MFPAKKPGGGGVGNQFNGGGRRDSRAFRTPFYLEKGGLKRGKKKKKKQSPAFTGPGFKGGKSAQTPYTARRNGERLLEKGRDLAKKALYERGKTRRLYHSQERKREGL